MKSTTTHYHAMSGLHGYMPDYNEVHIAFRDAVNDLVQLFDLGRRREYKLLRSRYLELNLRRDFAEYCEVMDCDNSDCLQYSEAIQ